MTKEEYGSNVSRIESILRSERIGNIGVNGGATTLVLAGGDRRFCKAFVAAAVRVSPALLAHTVMRGDIMCHVFHKDNELGEAWRNLLPAVVEYVRLRIEWGMSKLRIRKGEKE